MTTVSENHVTLDDILDDIKAYTAEPTHELLTLILTAISTLDTLIDRETALRALAKEKSKHNLTYTQLKKQVIDFMREANMLNDFFDDGKFLPGAVCDALADGGHYLTLPTDNLLRVYRSGVYREDTTSETAKTIDGWLGADTRPDRIRSALELLEIRTKTDVDRHTGYINLMNGRLCLSSWELLDHTPNLPSLLQLPVQYDPTATCTKFDAWLQNVLPAKDDQQLLLQLLGYSMLQDVRFGKIAVLYGPTHTGKSTCLSLVKALLGEKNTSALSLHALDNEDRRFSRSGLVEKLANISADLSSKYLAGDSQIKQIASGDPMQVEFKNGQPFLYKPFATLWASANQLPVSHDRTDAWYERLILLPFDQQHKGNAADRKVLDRMTEPSELSGILNRAIDALKQLIADNTFIETESTEALLAAYRLENDHVDRFLSETYTRVVSAECLEDDVYDAYGKWCDAEGIQALSKTKFRTGIASWGCPRKRKGTQTRYFVFQELEKL